ncbi:uncharacterized protein LOC131891489 [Tigriopus californicus]|uniref:uncharacterized protein LOC131891489 n=1 Tax=Tigriopus californicus TaxID=6832 RepID=UPI0027DAA993|nr:uncharacterized protein LOC131891489 [Tigriopus californicus]
MAHVDEQDVVIQKIREMEGEINALRQQNRNLKHEFENVQLGQARGHAQPNDQLRISLPILNKTTDRDYYRFETTAKAVASANGWTDHQTIKAVIVSVREEALDLLRPAIRDPSVFRTINDFWNRVRKQFVSPAHQQIARTEYQRRHQRPREDISTFHTQLHQLWEDAYLEGDEPWRSNLQMPEPYTGARADPTGYRSVKLINQFLTGLTDDEVRKSIKDAASLGHSITTYPDALTRALEFSANKEQTRMEKRRLMADHGPSFTQRKPEYFQPRDRTEPMEVGIIQTQSSAAPKWCRYHKRKSHNDEESLAQQRRPPKESRAHDQARRG